MCGFVLWICVLLLAPEESQQSAAERIGKTYITHVINPSVVIKPPQKNMLLDFEDDQQLWPSNLLLKTFEIQQQLWPSNLLLLQLLHCCCSII